MHSTREVMPTADDTPSGRPDDVRHEHVPHSHAAGEEQPPAHRRSACLGLTFSFRPELEALFREHYHTSLKSTVLTVAAVGALLNVYKLALGGVLLSMGPAEYSARTYDIFWDFYLWACPGLSPWAVAIVEPILEGGCCVAVVLSWPYAYSEGSPVHYQRNLLFFFFGGLLATVLLMLFIAEGELGKCATGQLVLVMFIYMMTLRPLVKHCAVMGFLVFVCFVIKAVISGIQCDVIADAAMVAATIFLGLGAAVAALERVERAHFVADQLAQTSHNVLCSLVDRMLPPVMAAQLMQQWGGHVAIGKRHEQVAVLFCDLQMPGAEALPTLMDLNTLFSLMDGVVDTVPDACKIETVGGQFVVAAGAPTECKEPATAMLLVATRIRAALRTSKWSTGEQVEMRIGMHIGPLGMSRVPWMSLTSGGGAAAGVVGTATPRFRLFGDTINTTARMSSRAQWGETVVSHAFAGALGLPPREMVWGAAGDVADIVPSNVETRLVCDGPVPIKGKGDFCVWRLESSEALLPGQTDVTDQPSTVDANVLFEVLVQKQEGLQDEGSTLARQMIVMASEYERILEGELEEPSAGTLLVDMLMRGSEFEKMFLRFKAPLMLPAQLVHAILMVMCVSGMFGVDVEQLLAARTRGEDVDLLIGVGIACNLSCLCGLAGLTALYRKRSRADAESITNLQATFQDACTVTVWLTTIVFLELVHAFGKGANVPSWAFVIAGFLRAHTLYNLLCNGLALHPQPLGFLVGCFCLLAARAMSHIMWEQRAANDELVTMISAQCGSTKEWKPRGLFQVLVILILTMYAYINRQLTERAAVQKLVATVRLRRRALEVTSSLLPPHVIPKLERRALQGSVAGLFSFAEKHESVIILHADVVGFTAKCARASPGEVFERISILFNALDDLCREHQLAKIETIGDAYLCSHGLEARATPSDARRMLRFAHAMRQVVRNISLGGETLQVRVGIHVGPMLGGIVGNRFPRYHLFGPHAKLAAVLEQGGAPEAPLVSDAFRRLLMQPEPESEAGRLDDRLSSTTPSLGESDVAASGVASTTSSNPTRKHRSFLRSWSSGTAKTDSWGVKEWRAVPQTPQAFNPDNIPDVIGPILLDYDEQGNAQEGAKLERQHDMEGPALEGLDPAVVATLNPCWLVHPLVPSAWAHRRSV